MKPAAQGEKTNPGIIPLAQRFRSSLRRRGLLATLRSCVLEIEELRFDRKYGVDTMGSLHLDDLTIRSANAKYGISYQCTKIATFREMFTGLQIPFEEFVFVDFGSGKGRAMLLASDLPFKKIVGIEFAVELHDIAQRNLRDYYNPAQRCTAFEAIYADVTQYELPSDNVVLYLFNPFGPEIVTRILANIRRSLAEHPRRAFLLYNNASCYSVVDQSQVFRKVRTTGLFSIYRSTI
jgi:hypothetical protein